MNSAKFHLIAFQLLAILTAGCGEVGSPDESATSLSLTNDGSTLPNVHELPLTPKAGKASAARTLSRDAQQMRQLWQELESFKHDPKFHVLGFDNPFQYGEWRGKVRTLNDRAGRQLAIETGIPPGELLVLGEEYQRNKGLRSERADNLITRLEGALNPKKKNARDGRVIRATDACADFDRLAQSLRLTEDGNYQGSEAARGEADCVTLPAGAIVSAPTRRRAYKWRTSKGQFVAVLVRSDQGDRWVAEDEILF